MNRRCLRPVATIITALVVITFVLQCGCETAPAELSEKCYVKEIGSSGKYVMHLEGTPYEMGYAMGYLRYKDVERMCSFEYLQGILDDSLGDYSEILQPLYNVNWLVNIGVNIVQAVTCRFKKNVPGEYIEEMRGIADGVKAANPDTKLDFNDVLMLNLSVDVFLSIQYSLSYPSKSSLESCNSYVAFDSATSDGRTLMGNHFMYPANVYHECALLVEYVPQNGHKFVSVTAPGFVGVTTAMNDSGIGLQTHVLTSGDTAYNRIGMGVLLLSRKTVQYSDTLQDAVGIIRDADQGVPWIYALGAPGGGAVVENTASHFAVRYAESDYADQVEAKDDIIVSTNHALVPEVVAVQYLSKTNTSPKRYRDLSMLLVDSYGKLDTDNGRGIIDFLHPGGSYNYYYGNDKGQPVACHVSLFDLTNRKVWSLFGLYTDPWVSYELK